MDAIHAVAKEQLAVLATWRRIDDGSTGVSAAELRAVGSL